MATVPGRSNVVPMMPEWAKPTQADFLQAAAIMHERDERFPKPIDTFDKLKLEEKEMEERQRTYDKEHGRPEVPENAVGKIGEQGI